MQSMMFSKSPLFLSIIAFRILNFFAIRTWFVPDEFYQSIEVAYRFVYSKGHISWEWSHGLRSFLHPGSIAMIYKLLQLFNIDSAYLITVSPRILHLSIYSIADYYYYRFLRRILMSEELANYAFFNYMVCWFVWYCAPRTIANALETALILIALNWFPLNHNSRASGFRLKKHWPYISLATITVLIRPTALIVWLPLVLWHLLTTNSILSAIFIGYILASLPILLFTCLLDSLYYGSLTLPIWNFVKFNLLDGGCSHFGTNPWHWYLSQGLFSLITVQVVPIIGGIYLAGRRCSITLVISIVSILYLIIHSLLSHKEHRFLLPIIPLLFINSGHFFRQLRRRSVLMRNSALALILVVNVILGLYFGFIHQIGPSSAIEFIRRNATSRFGFNQFTVLYLMPCYSMPHCSHYHGLNASIIDLDCSPNLNNLYDFLDESDLFHANPSKWVSRNASSLVQSDYVVIYEKTYARIQDMLERFNLSICSRIFHAHFPTSQRSDNFMLTLCSAEQSSFERNHSRRANYGE